MLPSTKVNKLCINDMNNKQQTTYGDNWHYWGYPDLAAINCQGLEYSLFANLSLLTFIDLEKCRVAPSDEQIFNT
jgi:hypothetical protein